MEDKKDWVIVLMDKNNRRRAELPISIDTWVKLKALVASIKNKENIRSDS